MYADVKYECTAEEYREVINGEKLVVMLSKGSYDCMEWNRMRWLLVSR